MKISEMVDAAHKNARKKGFWEDWYWNYVDVLLLTKEEIKMIETDRHNAIATRLALIHSEVSEALEALRKGDMENFAEELADVVIRIADLAGGLEIDLEGEIVKKVDKNKARGYKHGKLF